MNGNVFQSADILLPKAADMFLLLFLVGLYARHDGHDGLCTSLALGLGGQLDGHVHHVLHSAPILGHHQLVFLCVILHYKRFFDLMATNSFR